MNVRLFLSALFSFAAVAPTFGQPNCPPTWCAVGGPFSEYYRTAPNVMTLAVIDTINGPRLYAGGWYGVVEWQTAPGLASWDGHVWTPVNWIDHGYVRVIKTLDDGSGPALYVGGLTWDSPGGLPALSRFDGSSWIPILGMGSHPRGAAYTSVQDIAMFDSGSGPELYVGGWLSIESQPSVAQGVVRLTSSGFVPLGAGLSADNEDSLVGVRALTVFDDGSGPALYAGGSFTHAEGQAARNVARWDGQNWSPVGAGLLEDRSDSWIVPTVRSLVPWSDENGPVLLAAGDFAIGTVQGIASWRGVEWIADFGDFERSGIAELKAIDRGDGPVLYACGWFTTINGQPGALIARHINGEWDAFGADLLGAELGDTVFTAEYFDDGRGPAIFAGGFAFGHTDEPDIRTLMARYGTIVGDVNCDGEVSLADLALVLSAFGTSPDGDLNGDGETTLEDVAILVSKFGNACGA